MLEELESDEGKAKEGKLESGERSDLKWKGRGG